MWFNIEVVDIPCKIEYKFILDNDFDRYNGLIEAEDLYLKMRSFIKGPDYRRLWVFWKGFDDEPSEYVESNHIVI